MEVEDYEPLIQQLCRGIGNPHTRSSAEQEARIALWRFGPRIDAAVDSDALANRYIVQAKKGALHGRVWTGEGKGHNRCEHGDEDRNKRGQCLICRRASAKRGRERANSEQGTRARA